MVNPGRAADGIANFCHVFLDERITGQFLPHLAGTVEKHVLDIEIAAQILPRQAFLNGPLPIEQRETAVRQSLDVPWSKVAMLHKLGEFSVEIEKVNRPLKQRSINRKIESVEIGEDCGAKFGESSCSPFVRQAPE